MGPNMSSPERGGSTDPPTKDPPTNEEHNSQNTSSSSSTKLVNSEESTRLFDRLVELSETPTRSSHCDPSQVNLLIKSLGHRVPSVDLTGLFFAGTYPLNTLIDRPKENGDLVVSFLLPQDFPSSKEKLIHWTRGILRESLPLGIISILSFEQAKDILENIQSTHTDSTGKEDPLWKENSIAFFDCDVSWELDPSRSHCVVYKIQHQTHPIAVLRVDEAAKEHKHHFDSDRIGFAKAVVLPLILSLRIFCFKFAETESKEMENQNSAWWLPIVAERARRAREQRATSGRSTQTHHTPLNDYRVFGSTSQSWLGGYEANTFQPSGYQLRQHESSNTVPLVPDPATDSPSTPQCQEKAEPARASRKAAKKKAKKKAQKEAKKAELESSGLQENPTLSTKPVEQRVSHGQDSITDGPTVDNDREPPSSHYSPQPSIEKHSNPSTANAAACMSQQQVSTVSTVPTEQIEERPSQNKLCTDKAVADEVDSKPTKKSSLVLKSSPQMLSTQGDSLDTAPVKATYNVATRSKCDSLTESDSAQTPSLFKKESIFARVPSTQDDSSNILAVTAPLETATGSTNEKASQRSGRKKNKGKKKGKGNSKSEGPPNVDTAPEPKSIVVVSSFEEKRSSADPATEVSASPDEPSQAKQLLTDNPIGSSSISSSKSSKSKQTATESNSLPLNKTSESKQKSISPDEPREPSFAPSTIPSGNKSPSTHKLTGTSSVSCSKPSRAREPHPSTDKLAGSSCPSLKKSSKPDQTTILADSSSRHTTQESPSKLGTTSHVKNTNSKSDLLASGEPTPSSPKDAISNDNAASDKSEWKVVSVTKQPHLSTEQSDQKLPLKDQDDGEPKPGDFAEKGKKKKSKSKKRTRNSQKDRKKENESTVPSARSNSEAELTTSGVLLNKTQLSTSDAIPYNKSGSPISNTTLDNKPTGVSSEITRGDKSKSDAIPINKAKISDAAADQITDKKTPLFQNETDFSPLVRRQQGGSPLKQVSTAVEISDQAGMNNQASDKTQKKSAEKVKPPSQAEPAFKAPSTQSADKTKAPSSAETKRVQSHEESTRREAPVAGPASETRSTPTSTSTTSANPGTQGRQANQGFFWQLDSHGFPCEMAGCEKRCSSWDGASVICPRCGPYSKIRYCGKEHLFEDAKFHWLRCGTETFKHPCRASTIPREQKEGPPSLPSLHNWDTPERFRQAVRHAADKSGDYFVFGDWQDWVAAGRPANNAVVRCSTRVIYTVKFDDPVEKDRFRRVQGIALFNSLQSFELVGYLFRLIRGNALAKGQWSEELDLALQYQFNLEYGFAVGPWLGDRHACETEWTGANIRHCSDAVCRAERVQLLGDRGVGRGFQHLCEYMEGSHWLLRAARHTHPSVAAVEDRVRGEGFEGVIPEDRRVFRRGEGWDGVGTGDMEIEGVNVL